MHLYFNFQLNFLYLGFGSWYLILYLKMKIARHRRVRRYLKYYKNSFQFRSPYQILIDSSFCKGALQCKLNIQEQLPKYLEDAKVRLFTTSCVISEAEKLVQIEHIGPKIYGAMLIVKQFKVRKCGHEKKPVSATECLLSLIDNNNLEHFMIATQDRDLSEECRQIPGVPLLYISYNAIHLEKPSALNSEQGKTTVEIPAYQMSILKKLKTEAFGEDVQPKNNKRKIKNPNPLSCKPKKKKPKIIPQATVEVAQTRKRKRNKRKQNKALTQIVKTENTDT